MSHPYVIVISDSEEETEMPPSSPNPSSPADSDDEPEEYVPESEPEMESKLSMPPPPPYHETYYASGPRTVTVPKKRVAIRHRHGKSPVIPVLPNDPYRRPAPPQAATKYKWVRDTLEEWRKLDVFPPMPDQGESSNAQQKYPFTHEPPHHTIPILIAHSARQDDRLDQIEDAMMYVPGPEMMDNIDLQTTQLGNHLDTARADIVDLKHQAKESTLSAYVLEKRLDGVDSRIKELDEMVRYLISIVSKK